MTLAEQTRKMTEDFISSQSANDRATIQQAFAQIMGAGFGAEALDVGDRAEDFTLPNARGGTTTLGDLLTRGPVVLSFYRGGWCPYCNLEFRALNELVPQLKERDAQLVGISPELPDNSLSTVEKHRLQFEVLSDVGNAVARRYGIVMNVPEPMRPLYLGWELDVPRANGDETWELPIPATYVIARDGRIVAAYVNPDYTQRMEPRDVLTALDSLAVAST